MSITVISALKVVSEDQTIPLLAITSCLSRRRCDFMKSCIFIAHTVVIINQNERRFHIF